jgi:hypothetical protein
LALFVYGRAFARAGYVFSVPGILLGLARIRMIEYISKLPWGILILACLTLGLAPFSPPHIWEKLQMLIKGQLVRPIDWFDFVMHGTPWVVLVLKVIVSLMKK